MLRGGLGVLFSLGLILAAVPLASAQSQPAFTLEVKIDAASKTITKDLGSVPFHINVTVRQPAQNPLVDQFDIRLTVSLESTANNEFVVEIREPTSCDKKGCTNLMVKPGSTTKFLVIVQNVVSDPETGSAPFTFKVKSTPVFGGQTNPLTTAVVQQMSQEHNGEAKGTANVNLDASEKLSSFVKRYPLLFIGGAAGIFLVSIVLIRKRRGGLSVATDSPVQEVLPGRGASFPLQVTNEGNQKETLTLTTSDVPAGWSAILPVEKIELGPNETTTIWLTLKSPSAAQPGEHVQLNFVATSQSGGSAESLVEAVVVERYGTRTSAPPPEPASAPEPRHEPMMNEPVTARVAPKRRH